MFHHGEPMLHFNDEIRRSVTLLRSHSIRIEDGLTEQELANCEERFDFRFPLDLREFLQIVLPTGQGFPNWRCGDEAILRERLVWPFEGMAFDIEHNSFWLDGWGVRPSGLPEAIAVARRHVGTAPKLIPVFSHRYLPDEPTMAGNPFSPYIRRTSSTTERISGTILNRSLDHMARDGMPGNSMQS